MKVVEIVWLDAWIDTGDISTKKAMKLKPVKRSTIGYLVTENKHGIVMVTDRYSKKQLSTPMVIGWGMIEDYWIYEDG